MTMSRQVAVILGTRPEAVKMSPVIRNLQMRTDELTTLVWSTGQHRSMLDQVLGRFGIETDVDFNLMTHGQTLSDLTSKVLVQIDGALSDAQPDVVLVQGDTTTVFAASLACFYRRIPVAHVEAGLRSHRTYSPFPEEINRRLTASLAEIHFAPTTLSRRNLLLEGIPDDKVVISGNTVVDAITSLLEIPFSFETSELAGLDLSGPVLLVTSHRRESWGEELRNVCLALKDLSAMVPSLRIVYPVHMNPRVRSVAESILSGLDRIYLTEPLDYLTFVNLMRRAILILTDSGGIQEEAPTLQKPVLVLRDL